MQTIYRYELAVTNLITMRLPVDAQILRFACRDQHPDVIEFWALVNTEAPTDARQFRIVGTGHPFNDFAAWRYLDSVITAHGAIVWHVFER